MVNIPRFILSVVALECSCRGVFGEPTPSPTSSPVTISSYIDITTSPTSSPTPMFSYTNDTTHPDYPYCNGTVSFISDGYCDSGNNNGKCGWDGGDCCGCTCNSSSSRTYGYDCGVVGYACEDPDAPLFIPGGNECKDISFLSLTKPSVPSCPQAFEVGMYVESTSDALELANATSCSGGDFSVEWRGHVDVGITIRVLDGTSVRITGVSEAVANGGGTVPIFFISNGYLYLNNIGIANGNGSEGGAIFADSGSKLFVEGVSFTSNTAQSMGGAIFAVSSNATLVSTTFEGNSADIGGAVVVLNSTLTTKGYTSFHDNSAGYGGAVFAALNSIVIGSGNTTFINNNATEHGGAIFIAGTSYLGWNMQPVLRSTAQYSSMYSNSGENISTSTSSGFTSNVGYSSGLYENEARWIDMDENGDTAFMGNKAEGLGGAIYAESSQIFCSGSMLLIGNSAQAGGALYLESYNAVQTKGAMTFSLNRAVNDGGAIWASSSSKLIINGSTIFTGNTCGESGGAIYAVYDGGAIWAGTLAYDGAELTANGSITFTNNACGGNGGAIHLSGIYFVFNGNVAFSENSALSFGGALYASQTEKGPILNGVIFLNNVAKAGGAVFFSAVGTYEGFDDDEDEDPNRFSSKFISCRFEGNSASSTGGAIYSSAGKDLVWKTVFINNSADDGGALQISGTAILLNSSFVNNTSSEDGGPAIFNRGVISDMVGVHFSGNGYHCSPDAFMGLEEASFDESRYAIVCEGCGVDCQECLVENDTLRPVCEELPDHAQSRDGKATLKTLEVDPGYWRATTESRDILTCYNKKACRGGVTGNRDYCLEGYKGPYCAVCTQGYAGTFSYRCIECSKESSIVPAVCAIIIASLLVFLFVYYMISTKGQRATNFAAINRVKATVPLQSFKIIIISWQIVTQFSTVANAVYPRLYQKLLDVIALANFNLSWMPSAGCVLDVDFHVELIAATTGPFVLVALLGLTYLVSVHRNRESWPALSAVRRKHANSVIVVILLCYSSASSAVFRTFACDSLDGGKLYLRSDYRIECDSPNHKRFQIYAAFMIAVYPLGIPLLFALLLYRSRKALTNTSLRNDSEDLVQQSTSNFWKPYKPSAFYYEMVECGRRVMLTGVVVFIYPNTAAQIAVTLAIAFLFAFTSERLDPYDSYWDGWVSRIGHVMVVLTMYVALLAKVDVSGEGSQSQALFAGILVTTHIAMIFTAFLEAIVLICSIRQLDSPLPRTRSLPVLPVDDFS